MPAIDYEFNIYDLPSKIENLETGQTYTLPDMHSNAIYMLHCLAMLGVFKFTKTCWEDLGCLYSDVTEFKAEHFEEFADFLEQSITKDVVACPSIRFIGDTLADRGRHDFLILLIYECLHRHHISFSLIYSNHDALFFQLYKKQGDEQFAVDESEFDVSVEQVMQSFKSVYALKKSISSDVVSLAAVEKIIVECVLPHLKLIESEKSGDQIYIFTHAPTTTRLLKAILKMLGQEKKERIDDWPTIKVVDRLNQFFDKLKPQYDFSEVQEAIVSYVSDIRSQEIIDLSATSLEVNHLYIHGHDPSPVSGSHVHISIDGVLGKPGFDAGRLKIFVGTQVPVSPLAHARSASTLFVPSAPSQDPNPNPPKAPKLS